MIIQKEKRVLIPAFLKAAFGQPCTFRSAICNNDPTTTVAAHIHHGGMGCKNHDFNIFFACSPHCHNIAYDGYNLQLSGFKNRQALENRADFARLETMKSLFKMFNIRSDEEVIAITGKGRVIFRMIKDCFNENVFNQFSQLIMESRS